MTPSAKDRQAIGTIRACPQCGALTAHVVCGECKGPVRTVWADQVQVREGVPPSIVRATQPHPRACRCAGCCYDAVVDAALPSGLPRATYLDLAILALDEYGVSAELQTRIRNEIEDVIAGGDR